VQAFCELIPEKFEIDCLTERTQVSQDNLQQKLKEMDRCVEDMRQYNLQGHVDAQKLAFTQSSYNLADRLFEEILKQTIEDRNTRIRLIGDLARKCMEQTQHAQTLLTPFIVAVRKELNAPLDEEAYRRIHKVSDERWKKNLETYISSMEAKYDEFLSVKPPDKSPGPGSAEPQPTPHLNTA